MGFGCTSFVFLQKKCFFDVINDNPLTKLDIYVNGITYKNT